MTLQEALANVNRTAPCAIGSVRFVRNAERTEAHHATLGHVATIVRIGNHFEVAYAAFAWRLSGLFAREADAISEAAGRLNAVACEPAVNVAEVA
jgi:hypothetical protein